MILPEAEAILTGTDTPRINVRKGTFVGVVDKLAQVDMGDSRFVCDFGSGYIPVAGEAVRVWTVGDQHFLFPAGPRPTVGTVLTASGTKVTVETTVGTFTCAYAGAVPTSGDRVGLVWSEDGPWCSQRLSSSPPPPEPVPDPGGGPQVRSATFRAIDAGSTNTGTGNWWQSQPWASDTTTGAWFYGRQIKDTIPAGATLVSIEFYVSWQSRFGGAPNFGLHGEPVKAGLLTVVGAAPWDPPNGWQPLAYGDSWFPHLIGGGIYYGIGLDHGGWNRFSSLAEDSMSGALRISWRS